MKGGYQSIVWIKDKDGKEYACYLDDIDGSSELQRVLSDRERSQCLDVNEIVGTERW